jgi:hypothetical protein
MKPLFFKAPLVAADSGLLRPYALILKSWENKGIRAQGWRFSMLLRDFEK